MRHPTGARTRAPKGRSAQGCPGNRNGGFPLAGLGPAIHAFLPDGEVSQEGVGGRNKSGHGEEKLCGRL